MGGRGISVSPRWDDFAKFLEDMGERPNGLSIERINNNKGYYKENCMWATKTQQSRNQRRCKTNTTGFKGTVWNKGRKKFEAYIGVNNKKINLGLFTDLEKAKEARKQAELKYWE